MAILSQEIDSLGFLRFGYTHPQPQRALEGEFWGHIKNLNLFEIISSLDVFQLRHFKCPNLESLFLGKGEAPREALDEQVWVSLQPRDGIVPKSQPCTTALGHSAFTFWSRVGIWPVNCQLVA